jgi:nucleotide-binding universal stress UspA family protein
MRILCAVGQQGGEEIIQRLAGIFPKETEIVLLHVIDSGPRRGLEAYLGRAGQMRPGGRESLNEQLNAAEETAGQSIIAEARQAAEEAGFLVTTRIERGNPEHEIVRQASEQGCRLVVIRAIEGSQGRPQIGPASVGHTARFVLDHAPCDVLLLRN